MTQLIGLTGKKGTGKNTVADFIKDILFWEGYGDHHHVDERSFAAKLKRSAAAALGVTVEMLEAAKNDLHAGVSFSADFKGTANIPVLGITKDVTEECYHFITVREYLQRYGTEAHREVFGTNFWVDQALPLGETYPEGSVVVVTDVRFDNEAKRIKDLGGVIWNVRNPLAEQVADEHASEAGVSHEYIDAEVDNSDYEKTFTIVEGMLHDLLAPTA